MKAILLAAGEGKRMRPLTLDTPKPMIDVLGKPLLHHLIDGLPSEITELIMVIGYKGEQIKKYFGDKFEGRTVKYVIQKKQIGNADALELCKKYLKNGERFLFMFTDDLHSPKAIKALIKKNEIGTLVQEHPDPSRFGVFEVDKNNRVISMEEKPKHPKSNLVAVGVYVLDTRIFDYKVRQSVNGEYFMTDQIDQLIKDHKFVIEKTDFWHPIGYPHDIDSAEKILRSRSVIASEARQSNIPLIILAGGKGTRMPESEKGKPKLMAVIGKKFMLEHQIEFAKSQGFKNIIISLGYMADQIIAWLKEKKISNVRYVVEDKPLGTGGGIKLAVEHFGIKTPFIAINGDDIADVNYEGLVRHGSGGKYNVVTGMEIDDARIYGSIETDEHKKVSAFKEKDPNSMKAMVNIGHYYLKPEIFNNTPKGNIKPFSIERDIFPKLAKKRNLVLMKHVGNYWFGCGTPETLKATREYFSKSH